MRRRGEDIGPAPTNAVSNLGFPESARLPKALPGADRAKASHPESPMSPRPYMPISRKGSSRGLDFSSGWVVDSQAGLVRLGGPRGLGMVRKLSVEMGDGSVLGYGASPGVLAQRGQIGTSGVVLMTDYGSQEGSRGPLEKAVEFLTGVPPSLIDARYFLSGGSGRVRSKGHCAGAPPAWSRRQAIPPRQRALTPAIPARHAEPSYRNRRCRPSR
jgi:hypothetical protein